MAELVLHDTHTVQNKNNHGLLDYLSCIIGISHKVSIDKIDFYQFIITPKSIPGNNNNYELITGQNATYITKQD